MDEFDGLCTPCSSAALPKRLPGFFLPNFLLITVVAACAAGTQDHPQPPYPDSRIELSAIGYREPSRLERLSEDTASQSVHFLDADHVLLTFNPRTLFKRRPNCPLTHDDRMVRAVVLQLPEGKVVKETSWYLHDHNRYLWSLGPGTVLLRRGDDLYRVDSKLQEKPVFHSPHPLLWVSVTPDRTQILVETELPPVASTATPAAPSTAAKPEPVYQVEFFDSLTFARQRKVQFNSRVNLEASSAGYADSIHKGDVWLIRFGPSPEQRHNLARVRSRTTPRVFYSGNNSLLVGRCASAACDYSVTSFTISGRRLWQQHWSRYRTFPTVERDADASRFAVSTIQHTRYSISGPDSDQVENAVPDGVEQEVQVFEAASGTPLLTLEVQPPVLNGQNLALAPDGRTLVVLQKSGLEFFHLADRSQDEDTQLSALRAESFKSYAFDPAPDAAAFVDEQSEGGESSGQDEQITTELVPQSETEIKQDSSPDGHSATAAARADAGSALETAGQVNDELSEPVATFKASAKNVVVDVVVTDSKGRPIKGLPQEDFHVSEDGQPQVVRSFREFSETDSQASSAPEPPHRESPNLFWNGTQTAEQGPATMILFDVLNTPTADQTFARDQLIRYLEKRPKGSLTALCMLSGGQSSLRLIQGFTPDENLLMAAIKGKKGTPRAVRWQAEKTGTQGIVNTVSELNEGGRTGGWQNLLQSLQGMQAEQERTDTDKRVGTTLESMMTLGRYLSGIPGRKNLIWLSGSFPLSLAVAVTPGNPSQGSRNYVEKIRKMTNLLADAQVAVYPIDVRGLIIGDTDSSENGPATRPASGPAAATLGDDPVLSPMQANQQQAMNVLGQNFSEHETMTDIASATGGKATFNSNAIEEAIGDSVKQGSNYYSISYSPANKQFNGKFRKIKVALAQPGYTLHYRQGYFADDSKPHEKDADQARRVRSVAMQHGSPPAHQIQFSARVVPLGGKKKVDRAKIGEVLLASNKKTPLASTVEVQRYAIEYTVPASELRFVPADNGVYRNVLALLVASYDADGNFLSWRVHAGGSNLDAAAYKGLAGSDFHVHQEVQIPVDAMSLRLGIQDQMSDQMGTVEFALPVPPASGAPKGKRRLPEIEPD